MPKGKARGHATQQRSTSIQCLHPVNYVCKDGKLAVDKAAHRAKWGIFLYVYNVSLSWKLKS